MIPFGILTGIYKRLGALPEGRYPHPVYGPIVVPKRPEEPGYEFTPRFQFAFWAFAVLYAGFIWWYKPPGESPLSGDAVRRSRRVDAPGMSGDGLGAMPAITKIADGIQKAVAEDPGRMVHGQTKYNAFFITPKGIVPWNRARELDPEDAEATVAVHSHSAKNWRDYEELTGQKEPFSPLNASDVRAFAWTVANSMANTDVVIMADGRMEVLYAPTQARARLKAMQPDQIYEGIEPTDIEVAKYYHDHRMSYEDVSRRKLREFADRTGLVYETGLEWRHYEEPHIRPRREPRPYSTEKSFTEPPAYETKAEKYYTSEMRTLPRKFPIEPTQQYLFRTAPRYMRRGTYTHIPTPGIPSEPGQQRFLGAKERLRFGKKPGEAIQERLFPGLRRELVMEQEDIATSEDPVIACLERRGWKLQRIDKLMEQIHDKQTPDMFVDEEALTPTEEEFLDDMLECSERDSLSGNICLECQE